MKVRFTPQARVDIDTVYRNIARSNPDAAQRVEDLIRSKIERLGRRLDYALHNHTTEHHSLVRHGREGGHPSKPIVRLSRPQNLLLHL